MKEAARFFPTFASKQLASTVTFTFTFTNPLLIPQLLQKDHEYQFREKVPTKVILSEKNTPLKHLLLQACLAKSILYFTQTRTMTSLHSLHHPAGPPSHFSCITVTTSTLLARAPFKCRAKRGPIHSDTAGCRGRAELPKEDRAGYGLELWSDFSLTSSCSFGGGVRDEPAAYSHNLSSL